MQDLFVVEQYSNVCSKHYFPFCMVQTGATISHSSLEVLLLLEFALLPI
jgi:hypothetical protein